MEKTEHLDVSRAGRHCWFLRDLNKNKEAIHDPIYFKGESEGITVECAFQYINEFHENVLGFCNNIYNAEGGTHISGFKSTFTTIINSYAGSSIF